MKTNQSTIWILESQQSVVLPPFFLFDKYHPTTVPHKECTGPTNQWKEPTKVMNHLVRKNRFELGNLILMHVKVFQPDMFNIWSFFTNFRQHLLNRKAEFCSSGQATCSTSSTRTIMTETNNYCYVYLAFRPCAVKSRKSITF